jgi:hypothetical protein
MAAITIDTYALISSLKDAGVPEQQAKAQIDAMAKFVDASNEKVKHDYRLDEVSTKRDITESELKLESRIKDTELRIITQLSAMQQDIQMTKWTNRALLAVCTIGTGALIKIAFF